MPGCRHSKVPPLTVNLRCWTETEFIPFWLEEEEEEEEFDKDDVADNEDVLVVKLIVLANGLFLLALHAAADADDEDDNAEVEEDEDDDDAGVIVIVGALNIGTGGTNEFELHDATGEGTIVVFVFAKGFIEEPLLADKHLLELFPLLFPFILQLLLLLLLLLLLVLLLMLLLLLLLLFPLLFATTKSYPPVIIEDAKGDGAATTWEAEDDEDEDGPQKE